MTQTDVRMRAQKEVGNAWARIRKRTQNRGHAQRWSQVSSEYDVRWTQRVTYSAIAFQDLTASFGVAFAILKMGSYLNQVPSQLLLGCLPYLRDIAQGWIVESM